MVKLVATSFPLRHDFKSPHVVGYCSPFSFLSLNQKICLNPFIKVPAEYRSCNPTEFYGLSEGLVRRSRKEERSMQGPLPTTPAVGLNGKRGSYRTQSLPDRAMASSEGHSQHEASPGAVSLYLVPLPLCRSASWGTEPEEEKWTADQSR